MNALKALMFTQERRYNGNARTVSERLRIIQRGRDQKPVLFFREFAFQKLCHLVTFFFFFRLANMDARDLKAPTKVNMQVYRCLFSGWKGSLKLSGREPTSETDLCRGGKRRCWKEREARERDEGERHK